MTHSTIGAHTFEEVRYTDRCMCPTCREWFNSTSAFDFHRTGKQTDRRCLTLAEMAEKGMEVSSDNFWTKGGKPSVAIALRRQAAIDSKEGT